MRQKTKDNLIYLAVGLTIAAGFTTYMFYTERTTGRIQEIPRAILWAIFSTPTIVGLIFEQFWEYHHRRSLWIVSVVAASMNLSVVLLACFFELDPPLIVWSTMTGIWIIAVFVVAQKVVTRDRNQ